MIQLSLPEQLESLWYQLQIKFINLSSFEEPLMFFENITPEVIMETSLS